MADERPDPPVAKSTPPTDRAKRNHKAREVNASAPDTDTIMAGANFDEPPSEKEIADAQEIPE